MDRPLRIVVTTDWYAPETGGGAERVVHEVSRRLVARGHRVTIVATDARGGGRFADQGGADVITVHAVDLSGLLRAQAGIAPGLPGAVGRALRQRPDVVWAHSLQFQTTAVAAAEARMLGVPMVLTAHIGPLTGVRGAAGVLARSHEATLGRLILWSAARVIAVSESVRRHVHELSPRTPVDVVPNGIDTDRFRPVEPRVVLGRTRVRLGCLGRLVANKGPDLAISALAACVRSGVDAQLSFAGTGPEQGRLDDLAHRLDVADRVSLEGFRSDPEAWLQGIDILLRPSTTEGMPLGVLEAMASGVLVVASAIPGNIDVVMDGQTGLLAPSGDADAFARAICRLLADTALADRLRSAAIAFAADHSWDRTTELTEASLLRALARRVA
jgi:glycosyltransferase involved in cell wall biosynthesis